jgi:MYXO-CTERM domain-containing protein
MTAMGTCGRALGRISPLLGVLACWAGIGGDARAWSTPDAYAARASEGGGGRWFTGSPAEGFGCDVCHSPQPGQQTYPLYAAGLPLGGYSLSTVQEVVLSWPQFAARWREVRPDPTVDPGPDQPTPAMSLVAEFVPESGKSSGVVEIDAANAAPGELCEMTRPNLAPRLAARLYQVRAGAEALLIKPDSTGLMRCEARQLGQRCIVALTSCGASEVRIRWTTPPTWEGPIWFSAGFVATDALSGDFAADSVDQVSVPLVQADGESGKYERTLRSGCSLSPGPGSAGAGALSLAALGLALRRRRRRGR